MCEGGGLDRPYTGGEFSVSQAAGSIAYTGGDAGAPADVWVWMQAAGARRLTQLNAVMTLGGPRQLAPVRRIAVTAPDGRPIDAWLATPPGRAAGQRECR